MGRYVDWLSSRRSQLLVAKYRTHLKHCLGFLVESSLNLAPENIRPQHLSSLVEFLQGRRLGVKSRLGAYVVLRGFFDYLADELQLIGANPSMYLREPAPRALANRALTERQVEKLLGILEAHAPNGKTVRLIFSLQYAAAARIGEILKLRLADLNFPADERGLVRVALMSKNNKERTAFFPAKMVGPLKAHLTLHGVCQSNDLVFASVKKRMTPMRSSHLSAHLRRLFPRLGIQRKMVGTHIFRHSAAQHMLDRGADLDKVGRYLNHGQGSSVTSHYARYHRTAIHREVRKHLSGAFCEPLRRRFKDAEKARATVHR